MFISIGLQQTSQLGHVYRMPAQIHGSRQGNRNQPGILAGEKETQEIRGGFRNQRNPIALPETGTEQLACEHARLCAQFPVRKCCVKLTPARVKISACFTLCRVIQGCSESGEISGSKWQIVYSWCRYCAQKT